MVTETLKKALNRRYRARLGEEYRPEQLARAEEDIVRGLWEATERELLTEAHRLRALLFEDSHGLPLFDGDEDVKVEDIVAQLIAEKRAGVVGVNVRIPAGMHGELMKALNEEGRGLSSFITDVIIEYLELPPMGRFKRGRPKKSILESPGGKLYETNSLRSFVRDYPELFPDFEAAYGGLRSARLRGGTYLGWSCRYKKEEN